MRKEALISAMRTSISDVLETMFFMPVDVVTDGVEAGPDHEPGVAVSLTFTGGAEGRFVLEVPLDLAREVSSDFLGMDPDQLGDEDVFGTIKEMVNMLAGNALSLYDPDTVFSLGLPEPADMAALTGDLTRLGIQTLGSHMALVVELKQ